MIFTEKWLRRQESKRESKQTPNWAFKRHSLKFMNGKMHASASSWNLLNAARVYAKLIRRKISSCRFHHHKSSIRKISETIKRWRRRASREFKQNICSGPVSLFDTHPFLCSREGEGHLRIRSRNISRQFNFYGLNIKQKFQKLFKQPIRLKQYFS